MAKIYETKKDMERDHLAHQPHEFKTLAGDSFMTGLLSAAIIPLAYQLEKLRAFKADTLKTTRGGIDRFIGKSTPYVLGAISAFSFITAFMLNSIARDKEKQLEKLGPEEIVLPPDIGVKMGIATEGRHVARLQEQAAKTKDCNCPTP